MLKFCKALMIGLSVLGAENSLHTAEAENKDKHSINYLLKVFIALASLESTEVPPEVLWKKGALKIHCKIYMKTKKRLRRWCFTLNFAEFLGTSFYRTPPVAASESVSRETCHRTGSIKVSILQNF